MEIRGQNPLTNAGLRIPPHSLEAEQALLGSVMLRPDAIYEVIDIVGPQSFYFEKHRTIFETMLELFTKHQPIDLLSLSTRLKEKDFLERIGGVSFLTELSGSVPSSANIKHYADIVMKKFMMRQLIEASEHLSHLGFNEAGELEEILDQAEKKVFDITERFAGSARFKELKPLLTESFERFEKLSGPDHVLRGIHTGFKSLDDILSGFQRSDLVILAARPSVGKTAFALDLARRTALDHKTAVGFFSLEMTDDQLTDRLVSTQAKVNASLLRKGVRDLSSTWGTSVYENLSKAIADLMETKVHIDDQAGNTIMKMRSAARKLKIEKGLDLLIVDYLQLITPSSARTNDSTVQQVTEISRGLKILARELDIPIIALSQLSRAAAQEGNKEPQLHHLRDSGAIEQDADLVMFLHQEQTDEPFDRSKGRNIKLIIAKHRNGPLGHVNFNFLSHIGFFAETDYSNYGKVEEKLEDDFNNF